jgi:hypothetical protein
MFEEIPGSSWQGILTQYWGPGGFISSEVTHGVPYTDERVSAPSNLNVESMRTEVREAIKANEKNGWPQTPTSNDQFVVFVPPGTSYSSEAEHQNCGFHIRSEEYAISYVGWNREESGVLHECSRTVTAGHEYAESASDPHLDAWKDWPFEHPEEIADICGFEERGFLPGGIEVPALWDNSANRCSVSHSNPPQIAPEVKVETPAVKATEATLQGSVVPNGLDVEAYYFEWGSTTSYGNRTKQEFFPTGGPYNATAKISGLTTNTSYHFRLVAVDEGFPPNTTPSKDLEFKTAGPPIAITEPPTYTNTLEPQLNGLVNPERADTHYFFEYGLTTSYGAKIPLAPQDIGSGSSAVAVNQTLKGLESSKTYHYRVVAENEVATIPGNDQSLTTLPPCKGPEAKCVWSTQAPANPVPPSEFELKSVSCSSSTQCVAVGKNLFKNNSFVDLWNGTEWQLLSGTVSGEIKHISCVASGCVAAGVSGGAAETWLIFEFKGGAWLVQPVAPPLPSGATETILNGVSCSSETACTAVGSYHSESGYKPLVERWNGSSWSLQTAPNPSEGSAQNAMLSVACNTAISCIAVGEAAGKPVAETWTGSSWSLTSSPPLPSGAKGGKLAGVSCGTTSCIAVGDSYETIGNEKTLAEKWNGSSWSITTTPNPSEAKGFVNLVGVSCSSSSACTATGYFAPSVSGGVPVELKTLAETWNGSSWSIQSSPNASGKKYNALMDVSCTSSSACTAVGQDSFGFGQPPASLAERWNGSSWSIQSVANPQAPIENELKGVSCTSSTLCIAAGKNLYAENSFAELWNGTEWTVISSFSGEIKKISCLPTGCVAVGVSGGAAETWLIFEFKGGAWLVQPVAPPLPSGATETILNGVSCGSETACTAVGSYHSESGYKPLVERWNGSSWSLQTAPNPSEGSAQNAMLSVACNTAISCIAVGEAANKPVAERWNGSEWSLTSPPNPSGAKGAKLAGVSCGSASACMAVGDYYETTGNEKTLVERWNGSSWSIVTSPNPSEAKGFVNLTDVSCVSPNSCFAAGYFASNVSGGLPLETKTLAETWNGSSWSIQSSPNAPSQHYNALVGISCTSSIACTAVGSATSSLSGRPVAQLAERYE